MFGKYGIFFARFGWYDYCQKKISLKKVYGKNGCACNFLFWFDNLKIENAKVHQFGESLPISVWNFFSILSIAFILKTKNERQQTGFYMLSYIGPVIKVNKLTIYENKYNFSYAHPISIQFYSERIRITVWIWIIRTKFLFGAVFQIFCFFFFWSCFCYCYLCWSFQAIVT